MSSQALSRRLAIPTASLWPATWSASTLPEAVSGKLFFDGTRFYVADTGRAWVSEHGATWEELPFADARLSSYSIARSGAGTHVAIMA